MMLSCCTPAVLLLNAADLLRETGNHGAAMLDYAEEAAEAREAQCDS